MASRPPIFALIVGIDNYEKYTTLKGVKDAEIFRDCLLNAYRVPRDNICVLLDKSATRKAIFDHFHSHLLNNPKIKKRDQPTIIFFFAGHGSRVRGPIGWNTDDDLIETICPVDDGLPVPGVDPSKQLSIPGIPDLTISALLDKLARQKGDNIIVIFDSCHSAGGTREDPVTSFTNRSVEVDYDRDGYGVHFHFVEDEMKLWRQNLPNPFRHQLHTHVLLAACDQYQNAWEDKNGGIFTAALCDRLSSSPLLSYSGLMQSLRPLVQERVMKLPANMNNTTQYPICYGMNSHRLLFDVRVSVLDISQLKLSPVMKPGSGIVTSHSRLPVFSRNTRAGELSVVKVVGDYCFLEYTGDPFTLPPDATVKTPSSQRRKLQFSVGVGTLHGITRRSRFAIIWGNKECGKLDVQDILLDKTILSSPQGWSIPHDAKAFVLASDLSILNVFVTAREGKLRNDLSLAGSSMKHHFRVVKDRTIAHVVISLAGKSLQVERLDPLMQTAKRMVNLPFAKQSDIPRILDNIANFRYHLGRSVASDNPHHTLIEEISQFNHDGTFNGVGMRLHKLGYNSHGFREPESDHSFHQPIQGGDNIPYGIEITASNVPDSIYPYLFCFDPEDYTIAKWHHPNEGEMLRGFQSKKEVGLSSVKIGYGPGGGNPITFKPGETVFLKLFVSGTYCDLRFMAPDGHGARAGPRHDNRAANFTGAWVLCIKVNEK